MAPAARSSLERIFGSHSIDGPNAEQRASSCIDAPEECCLTVSLHRTERKVFAMQIHRDGKSIHSYNEEIRIMRRTHVTEQIIDQVIGRRIFTLCWFCAGLGVSILQMQLLAQAWSVSRQALMPACIVSAWVLGSLVGSRRRTTARVWGGCLLVCAMLWFGGTRLVSWRIGQVPTTWLSDGALIISAVLLGAISTAWLVEPRPWPTVDERAALARGLVGATVGLCIVWMLPAWAGLIALAC